MMGEIDMPYGWNSDEIRRTIKKYEARRDEMARKHESPESIECLNRLIAKMEKWEQDAKEQEGG